MLKKKISKCFKIFFILIHKTLFFDFFWEKFNIFIDYMIWYHQANFFVGNFLLYGDSWLGGGGTIREKIIIK
jgi:hypothetical protein